jgi:hypothetical protein
LTHQAIDRAGPSNELNQFPSPEEKSVLNSVLTDLPNEAPKQFQNPGKEKMTEENTSTKNQVLVGMNSNSSLFYTASARKIIFLDQAKERKEKMKRKKKKQKFLIKKRKIEQTQAVKNGKDSKQVLESCPKVEQLKMNRQSCRAKKGTEAR